MNKQTVQVLGVVLILLNFWFYQRFLLSPLWTKNSSGSSTTTNTTGNPNNIEVNAATKQANGQRIISQIRPFG